MVSAPFDYIAADSYQRAVGLLAEHGDAAKVLAGGQSLGPMLNLRLAQPDVLIDISGVPAGEPAVADGVLTIPALTRHRDLINHQVVRDNGPLLSHVAGFIGNVRVRNRGTIGGSLAHCDPTAELGIATLSLGAEVEVLGERGTRTIPVSDLFVSYLTTSLEPTELITGVRVPVPGPRSGWGFQEMVRRTSDLAIVAVAVTVRLGASGDVIEDVRVSLAGVGERVVAVGQDALAPLVGQEPAERVIAEVAAAAAGGVEPDSDAHASGDYRKRLVAVLTRRALSDAIARAKGASLS